MRNKTYIANITLSVLLVSSLVGNFILYNQFSISKQTLDSFQRQLGESKVKLQDAQSDWKRLQVSLAVSTQIVPAAQVPVNPNEELKSGLTLAQVKVKIDAERKKCITKGYSDSEMKSYLTMIAKDLGTTLDTVDLLPSAPEAVIPAKPAATQPAVTKPAVTQQAQSQTEVDQSKIGTPGAFTKSAWDKNGDGINDGLAGSTVIGGGTTHSDPSFNPKAN